MNITILDFDDIKNPLLAAGQAKSTLEVGKRLAQKSHTITVISSRYPGYKDRTENGINYKHIGIGTKNIRLNNIIYILALPFAVRKLQTDIIIECFTAPVSTLLTPLWTKIPVVGRQTSFEAERFSKKYHLPFYLIEKQGAKYYQYFLAATPFGEQKIKSLNPKIQTAIIPEGVDDEYFTITPKEPEHILFLARLDISQKGIDLLLESYKNVADEIPYPLVIAGHGPDEEKIKTLIKNHNLQKKVQMIGSCYKEKKKEALSRAIYTVIPSRNESFCLFGLESLASGIPLVTFDIPGLSWCPQTVALKSKPFSIVDYSSNLKKASLPQINKQLRLKTKEVASTYTWDICANKYEKFLLSILSPY